MVFLSVNKMIKILDQYAADQLWIPDGQCWHAKKVDAIVLQVFGLEILLLNNIMQVPVL
jgi:hypothetical protein